MPTTRKATPTRVVASDGTSIAYWTSGTGPPLVLVHGGTADHTRWQPLLPWLEPVAAVHAMDRRGRAASGDGPRYDVTREFEDVAAVVDAIATETGSGVDVYGHSYGGLCAFGAARLTTNVRRLVLYEGWPTVDPQSMPLPPGADERLDAMVAAGQREAALEVIMREIVLVSEDELRAIRAQPSWQSRVANVHTVTRELRAMTQARLVPGQAAQVTAPTLLLTGSDSPDHEASGARALAAVMPDAQVGVLDGQRHLADVLAPQEFARTVLAFLRG